MCFFKNRYSKRKLSALIILYIDNEITTTLSDPNQPVEDYDDIKTQAKYPCIFGLTGLAIQKRDINSSSAILYANSIELDLKFNEEIDNIERLRPLWNIAIFELSAFDIGSTCKQKKDFNTVGVVQLFNKLIDSDFPYVTKKDIV